MSFRALVVIVSSNVLPLDRIFQYSRTNMADISVLGFLAPPRS